VYDDDYSTCTRTYATLSIYPVRTDPETITELLGIEPSSWQRTGGPMAESLRRPPGIAELDLWCLTTKDRVKSRDSRRHIDWLLNRIEGKTAELRSTQLEGARMSVSCFWLSKFGEGGPTISPQQMTRLGELNIELWFDVYFDGEGEDPPPSQPASSFSSS
jgi:Domain of unknown function (DUF4279)